jgi:hypothetical protein
VGQGEVSVHHSLSGMSTLKGGGREAKESRDGERG